MFFARDPHDAYHEWRDNEMVRDIVNDKARSYVLNQVHIGYPELKSLLTFRFRETWHSEIGDREAGYSEAEHALTRALAAAIHEIQEVRALALDEGSSLKKESPAMAEGSSPSAAPSAWQRFWNRMRRNPWL